LKLLSQQHGQALFAMACSLTLDIVIVFSWDKGMPIWSSCRWAQIGDFGWEPFAAGDIRLDTVVIELPQGFPNSMHQHSYNLSHAP